jgi:hypothetical protein
MWNVHLESKAPLATTMSIRSDLTQEFLDTVYAIHFEALSVPIKNFTASDLGPIKDDTEWTHVLFCGKSGGWWGKMGTETPKEFQKNIEQGVWSCLLLGFAKQQKFLLVVEWIDALTAVRVGGTAGQFRGRIDAMENVEQTCERIKVRLI